MVQEFLKKIIIFSSTDDDDLLKSDSYWNQFSEKASHYLLREEYLSEYNQVLYSDKYFLIL